MRTFKKQSNVKKSEKTSLALIKETFWVDEENAGFSSTESGQEGSKGVQHSIELSHNDFFTLLDTLDFINQGSNKSSKNCEQLEKRRCDCSQSSSNCFKDR